ncbi:MAG: DUF3795 domain-containing protein [Ignavibacteriales bacterium]
MEPLNSTSLIAPCGINCGVCRAHLRARNKCVGCRGSDSSKPQTRTKCNIKNCTVFSSGEVKYCYGCENYPCDNLKHLDKRYRTKYGISMIKNLEDINACGMDKFLENEKEKWTCKECGGTICVHTRKCDTCEMTFLK